MKSISLAFAVVVGAVALPAHAQPNSETNSYTVAATVGEVEAVLADYLDLSDEALDYWPTPKAGLIGGGHRRLNFLFPGERGHPRGVFVRADRTPEATR